MLKVVPLSHFEQKQSLYESFQGESETWLVSDLRSKFEIQRQILTKRVGYEEQAVLRASDLWRTLLRRLRPELRTVSRGFLQSWLTHHLRKMSKLEGAGPLLQPQSARSFLELIDLLVPVFVAPLGPQHLAEFFETHPEAAARWQVWSELSHALFRVILSQNWVLPKWIPSLLQQEERLGEVWNRDLVVDLGAELRQSEVDLLMELSRQRNVLILLPKISNQEAFSFLLQPCENLRSQASQFVDLPLPQKKGTQECLRLSGPLAEVKQAVAQIRKWLEQGVQPNSIAIVAPQIEPYWPLLEPYFAFEGIPTQMELSSRLNSWPSVGSWLALLRLRAGQVSYADAEFGVASSDVKLRFEKFQALFRQALEVEDLENVPEMEAFFSRSARPNEDLDLESFMGWASLDWKDLHNWDPFEILLKEMLQNDGLRIVMDLESWMTYTETLAAEKEVRLKPSRLDGIALLNLSSVEGGQFEKRIFLGLSESQFKKSSSILVGAQELSSLGWDFGYFLDHPEQNLLDFKLRWALQSSTSEDWLYFPATSFSASAEAPHPVWLQAGGGEKVHLPWDTRWDEWQASDFALNEKMKRDQGLVPWPEMKPLKIPKMSISSVERFRNCGFQFAAEKMFLLLDIPERDLDLDARSKGSLAHKIFETLTQEPMRFDWSEAELMELIDSLKKEVRLEERQGLFWEVDRKRHVTLAQRFLKFEEQWRKNYPLMKIEGRESAFEFYFDLEKKTFQSEPVEPGLHFRGAIDRIENDSNGWKLVVDYKRTHQSKRSFVNWIEENSLQLGFYSWVVDRGWVRGLSPGTVGGAVTFAYQTMEKKKGLVLTELVGKLAPQAEPKGAGLQTKEDFYQEFEELLKGVIAKALDGKIEAKPFEQKEEICDSCRWSQVCRGPHLNL